MDRHQGQKNYSNQICCTGDGFVEGATWNNATLNSGTNDPRDRPNLLQPIFNLTFSKTRRFNVLDHLVLRAQRKKWNDWKVKKTNAAMWSCAVFRAFFDWAIGGEGCGS